MDDEQKQASTHPSKIITDRGGEFVWHAFQQTLKDGDYGIDLILMTKANESASKNVNTVIKMRVRVQASNQPDPKQVWSFKELEGDRIHLSSVFSRVFLLKTSELVYVGT